MNTSTLHPHPKPAFYSGPAFFHGSAAYGFQPLGDAAARVFATTSSRVALFGFAASATGLVRDV